MHPLPVSEEGKAVLLARLVFYWLPNSGYNLYIRKHGYRLYGISSDLNKNMRHEGRGEVVPFVHGIYPDGGSLFRPKLEYFYEPRHRQIPSSGRNDDTIIEENDYVAVTKRKTDSWEDVEENFTVIFSTHQAEQYGNLQQHIELLTSNNQDLELRVKDQLAEVAHLSGKLTNINSAYKTMRTTATRVQEENLILSESSLTENLLK